jgi:transposase
MPKPINFHLTRDELAHLGEVSKHDPRPEVRQRALAMRSLGLGEKPAAVARLTAMSQASIYRWWQQYQQAGVEGLANRPKGRPETKADAEYLHAVETALASDPQVLGYTFVIWTLERLRDHLVQVTGVHLSLGHLRELMLRHGYVYRRPKHDLGNHQDPIAKAQAQTDLTAAKKVPKPVLLGFSLWTRPR